MMKRRNFLKFVALGATAMVEHAAGLFAGWDNFLLERSAKASELKLKKEEVMSREARSAGPLAQDYTIVAKIPSRDVFFGGPGLVKLPSGRLFVTTSLLPRRGSNHIPEVRMARSDDGGRTWKLLTSLPYYTSCPFTHDDRLYLFAHRTGRKYRNDDVLILCSDDEGEAWSQPVTLFEGHFWNCPTGIVVANGQVYRAIDRMDMPGRGEVVIAGDLSRDLMSPKSWRMSPAVAYPGTPSILRRGYPNYRDHWLEPNVVNVRGRLMVLSRTRIAAQTTASICGICDLEDDGEKMDLRFTQFYPVPGAQNKFHVIYDHVTRLFWMATNLVIDSQSSQDWWEEERRKGEFRGTAGNERRLLILMYSIDALNWFQAGCVAMARKPRQSFMYAAPLIDGDDMLIISRTSKDAPDQHDADLNTFHRVESFRSLALDLYPQI